MSARDAPPAEVAAGLEAGELVALDVRTPEEWTAGHIGGATWIPMHELGARLDELPAGGRLAIVCRSGARSGYVADRLASVGYDAVNLGGGMEAWVAAGLPIEPEDGLVL